MKSKQTTPEFIETPVTESKPVKSHESLYRTLVIAFVVALLAFIGGNMYANHLTAEKTQAVESALKASTSQK